MEKFSIFSGLSWIGPLANAHDNLIFITVCSFGKNMLNSCGQKMHSGNMNLIFPFQGAKFALRPEFIICLPA